MRKLTRYTRGQRGLLRRNDLERLSKAELKKAGFQPTNIRFKAPGQSIKSSRSPTLPYAVVIEKQIGKHPVEAARLRKEGTLGYGPGGLSGQAPRSVRTRISHQEQRALNQYDRTPIDPNVYINRNGVVAYDYFWKDNLRIMHNYRDDVIYSRRSGHGERLRKYRRMTIMTYDGPGLPGYDNKGVRVYPETSLRKILKVEDAMTGMQKAEYHRDQNYRHLEEAA